MVDAFLRALEREQDEALGPVRGNCHKVVTKSDRSCTVSCPGGGAEATARLPRRRLAVGTLLATHAIKTTDAPLSLRAVRLLDVAVLALALPVFVAAGWPLFAWAGVTAAWLAQRGVQALIQRRASTTTNPRTAIGLLTVSLMGRIWFLMFAVLAIGLIDRDSGPSRRGAHPGHVPGMVHRFHGRAEHGGAVAP